MNGNELIDMHDLWPGIVGISPGGITVKHEGA